MTQALCRDSPLPWVRPWEEKIILVFWGLSHPLFTCFKNLLQARGSPAVLAQSLWSGWSSPQTYRLSNEHLHQFNFQWVMIEWFSPTLDSLQMDLTFLSKLDLRWGFRGGTGEWFKHTWQGQAALDWQGAAHRGRAVTAQIPLIPALLLPWIH